MGPATHVSACESNSQVEWCTWFVCTFSTLRSIADVGGLLDVCLGPVRILLILRLDICDPAASGFERLSPICVPGEAFASAMAVGRVIADCMSWSAEIRADILDPC